MERRERRGKDEGEEEVVAQWGGGEGLEGGVDSPLHTHTNSHTYLFLAICTSTTSHRPEKAICYVVLQLLTLLRGITV